MPRLLPKRFDDASFLRDYWQKAPLLIRNPWESWSNPLDPDALAGLACGEEVESRLVTRQSGTWTLEHGPFPEARFATLGGEPWTVLVQAVDHFVPEVAALIEPFRFVPNWRIDDVMVSYATDGGGVGPHFDHYDVFLIQGLGRRRWRIGGLCDPNSALLPHDDLRLLAEFQAEEEWILEPGDILYVPPGIAHEGEAVGDDCMTYSIGFRAPSRGELIAGWSEHRLGTLRDDDRFADPDLEPQDNPGEISRSAIDRLHFMVVEAARDRDSFARWFGQFSTTTKYPDIDWRPDAAISTKALRERLAGGASLHRNPASRFSFIRREDGPLLLFADGETFECEGKTATLAEHVCAHEVVQVDQALIGSKEATALLKALIDRGSLAFDRDD